MAPSSMRSGWSGHSFKLPGLTGSAKSVICVKRVCAGDISVQHSQFEPNLVLLARNVFGVLQTARPMLSKVFKSNIYIYLLMSY